LLQGWNSCCVRPEPLLIKDIKVQANKQKPKIECPAQMKHNSDKMTIAPMSSQPCGKPNVEPTPAVKIMEAVENARPC
jgi:Ser-tRNA(Ala) deacylase AlaX